MSPVSQAPNVVNDATAAKAGNIALKHLIEIDVLGRGEILREGKENDSQTKKKIKNIIRT